jgi:type IV pilus assembly protein PilO
MSMTRRWSLLTAVLIVAILAASWFLLVSPKRSEAAELRGKAAQEQAANDALVVQLNQLKAQSLDLPKKKAELAVLATQIPDNPALPTLVRSLTAAGKKVGVSVIAMKPGTPAAAAVAVPTTPVAAPATNPDGTPATNPDGTPATGTATDGSATTTTPPAAVAPTAAPLYVVPLSLTVNGSYFEVEQFIGQLENLKRKFLLTGFVLTPVTSSGTTTEAAPGSLNLELSGQVFLSPNVAPAAATSVVAPSTAQAQ